MTTLTAVLLLSWHRDDGQPLSAENHEPAIVTEVQDGRLVALQRDSASDKILGYWTLERRGDRWLVLTTFDEDEGRRLLEGDVVAVPWADRRVGAAVALELAGGDGAHAGGPLPAPPGVAYGPQAVEMLNDLSVVDQLMARDDDLGTERAVREVRVIELGVSAAELSATPPWVRIGAVLSAYWYRRIIGTDYSERILPEEERERATEDPGDPYGRTELYARLTLAMDGNGRSPWRLHGAQVRPRR